MKIPQLILLVSFSLVAAQLSANDTKPYQGKIHSIPGLIEASK